VDNSVIFSMQADPAAVGGQWAEFARACERDGFEALLVADHPGSASAPFVALAAAATATDRLRLGSYVANAGAWEPLTLAAEVATLDVVSGGRALFGIGAGHTPAEWTMSGRDYPSARDRVARMIEVTEVTRRLLAGDRVSVEGAHVIAREAVLAAPRPIQRPVPLLVGGSGSTVLRFAAREADIVGFSGLGRTLEDGHRHEVRWKPRQVEEQFELVRAAAEAAGRTPSFEALVQVFEITDDAGAAAELLAERVRGTTVDDLLAAPFVLIGTIAELVSKIQEQQRRFGISRYVVRAPAREAAARLLSALRS
jgi:probable F420-dependent oxidoreductase